MKTRSLNSAFAVVTKTVPADEFFQRIDAAARWHRSHISANATEAPSEKSQGQGTILLVDDEEMIRKLTKRNLEKMGYEVLLAKDGFEALEVFQANIVAITCVLLDLDMPRMCGDEAFVRIRAIKNNIPIIVSSGTSNAPVIRQLINKGQADFLMKPYRSAALKAKLREVLG